MDVLILEPLPDFEDFVIVYSKINKLLSGRVISSKYEKNLKSNYDYIVCDLCDDNQFVEDYKIMLSNFFRNIRGK